MKLIHFLIKSLQFSNFDPKELHYFLQDSETRIWGEMRTTHFMEEIMRY